MEQEIDELRERLNRELEVVYTEENSRIQSVLAKLQKAVAGDSGQEDANDVSEIVLEARAELTLKQTYQIGRKKIQSEEGGTLPQHRKEEGKPKENWCISTMHELKASREVETKWLSLSEPTDLKVIGTDLGRIRLRFNYLNTKEEKVLAESGLKHTALLQRKGAEKDGKEYELKRDGDTNSFWFTPDFLEAETECVVKVRVKFKDKGLKWSEGAELTTKVLRVLCLERLS